MEIILLEKVRKLGAIGEIVSVKNGYGRNFLIPTGKAMRASKANLAEFEAKKHEIEKENQAKKESATKLAESLRDAKVILVNQAGEDGRLFGSIAAKDIVSSLKEKGFIIDKSAVVMNSSIKYLGIYVLELALHSEVSTNIYLNIARSKEEANDAMQEYLMEKNKKNKKEEPKAE